MSLLTFAVGVCDVFMSFSVNVCTVSLDAC